MGVGVIILAAGLSTRMQANKLLLPLAGKAILAWTVESFLASRAEKIVVVLGRDGEKVKKELATFPVCFVENIDYVSGMASSVRAGVRYFTGGEQVDGLMICPGDMPYVKTATINALMDDYFSRGPGIIAPFYGERRGHPVLFHRQFFPELLAITGDSGGREVVRRNEPSLRLIPVDDPGIHIDIDSPEIYRTASEKGISGFGGGVR